MTVLGPALYEVCDACNYERHRCHFCGADLPRGELHGHRLGGFVTTLADLAGGIYVKAGAKPDEDLHAVGWTANSWGARRAACGKVGRFVPRLGDTDFAKFPTFDDVDDRCPPMRQVPVRQLRRHQQGRLEVTR